MDHASSLSSALLRDTQDKAEEEKLQENKQDNKPSTSLVKPRTFKIIVLGESGVGKTCLSFRFCAGKFPLHSESTIGLDFREKVNPNFHVLSTYKFPLLRLSSWMEKGLSYNYGTQQARRGSRGQSPTTTTGMSAPLSLCMTLLAWQASLL